MTSSPSDGSAEAQVVETPDPLAGYAAEVGEALAAVMSWRFRTIKARVPPERWVEAATLARDRLGLTFFSWLSAIDWANEVQVGDPPAKAVEERFEVLCEVSDVGEGRLVVLSTDISKEDPHLPTLVGVYPGANWHEREAAEMFGIRFDGHPNLVRLYLPGGFEGHPLRKSFALLTRVVKPWPGTVDVEGMPSEENVEAGDVEAGEE